MSKTQTTKGFEPIDAEIIEPSDPVQLNSSDGSKLNHDGSALTFPLNRVEAGEALGISNVMVSRYIKELTPIYADYGQALLDASGKITVIGFNAIRSSQQSPLSKSEYLAQLKAGLRDSVMSGEPLPEPTESSGSGYAMIVSERHDRLALNNARLDLQRDQAMEALLKISQAKQDEQELQALQKTEQEKQWDLEIIQSLAQEAEYKARRAHELRQKLGL
jgi:hypothetical protein